MNEKKSERSLTNTGENDPKCARLFSTQRSVCIALTRWKIKVRKLRKIIIKDRNKKINRQTINLKFSSILIMIWNHLLWNLELLFVGRKTKHCFVAQCFGSNSSEFKFRVLACAILNGKIKDGYTNKLYSNYNYIQNVFRILD